MFKVVFVNDSDEQHMKIVKIQDNLVNNLNLESNTADFIFYSEYVDFKGNMLYNIWVADYVLDLEQVVEYLDSLYGKNYLDSPYCIPGILIGGLAKD